MRRLFSPFARGWPGAGLFLLRIAAGGVLLAHGISGFQSGRASGSVLFTLPFALDGALLIVGLWTPLAGTLAAALSIWGAVATHNDRHAEYPLLIAIGIALALVGPGAFSIDARLFGWKRIDL